MLNTGLREGEACALLKSDVNLQDRLVSVNKNIISVRSGKEDDEKHWIKKVKNTEYSGLGDTTVRSFGNRYSGIKETAIPVLETNHIVP